MSPFRRKRDGEEQSSQDSVEAQATPAADEPDPAAWALPADAGAVTTDAGTAATVAEPEPAPAASTGWAPPTSPGQDPLETFNEVTEQRPELLVAGAFAGAFCSPASSSGSPPTSARVSQTDLARAVQEVSDRASVLIREEIELAKAEVSAKVTKLAKGAAIGAAAGVFLLGATYCAGPRRRLVRVEGAPGGQRRDLARLPHRRRSCSCCSRRSPPSSPTASSSAGRHRRRRWRSRKRS